MAGRKTPLFGVHEGLGARIVDFHGWLMPVQYSGVVEEHLCVRENAGLFDVSHMGEFLVFGSKATDFLDHLVANDVAGMADGQCLYTPMCYESGGIVDDLLVYRHNSEHYMLVVNAGNIERDCKWIESNMGEEHVECGADSQEIGKKHGVEVGLRDVSDNTAMLALQGPSAQKILAKTTDTKLDSIRRFRFADNVMVGDVKTLVSRTGYTGEDGFELYVNPDYAVEVWDSLMEAGEPLGIQPVGLGARDTLRLEAGLMLYGNDIDESTTPLEAGIGWTVKLGKKGFIGKDELLRQRTGGLKERLVGLELLDKGVPRHGYRILSESDEVGRVTSGSYSPTLKKGICMGYVKKEHCGVGSPLDVEIRDKLVKTKVVDLPFIKKVR